MQHVLAAKRRTLQAAGAGFAAGVSLLRIHRTCARARGAQKLACLGTKCGSILAFAQLDVTNLQALQLTVCSAGEEVKHPLRAASYAAAAADLTQLGFIDKLRSLGYDPDASTVWVSLLLDEPYSGQRRH